MIHSALHTYEDRLFATIAARLSEPPKQWLQRLIKLTALGPVSIEAANAVEDDENPFWLELRRDPGRPSLATALTEAEQVKAEVIYYAGVGKLHY